MAITNLTTSLNNDGIDIFAFSLPIDNNDGFDIREMYECDDDSFSYYVDGGYIKQIENKNSTEPCFIVFNGERFYWDGGLNDYLLGF